jgi:hypothetical protein
MATNKIELNKELRDKFEGLFGVARTSVLEQVKLASLLRNQYLDETGRKYDPAFQAFWKDFSMDELFKSLSNFTKYAAAGDAISKVEKRFEQHFKRLPMNVSALYEVAQLTDEELQLCLHDTYKRFEITSDRSKWKSNKKPRPLINPQVTASEISNWRKNWNNPKAAATDKRRLKLAEIYVHGSLYDFDRKTADFIGRISKEYVQHISDALVALVENYDSELIRLDLKDEALFSGHDKRAAAAIKALEVAKESAKKKTSKQPKKSVKRSRVA